DGDYRVIAKVTTPEGKESQPSTEAPFNVDQTTPVTPTIDITRIAGQDQVAEGTDGYAQFLPKNIATETFETSTNTVEGKKTTIETKGFIVSGTTKNVPADTEVVITITGEDGTKLVDGQTAKVNADGTWSVNVVTVTTTTVETGDPADEENYTNEVTTSYNAPTFDQKYTVSVVTTANGEAIRDEDVTESAPKVVDIYLQDNLTDDVADVAQYYTNNDPYVGRIDGMNGTDAMTAVSRATGLTNDPNASLHFTLDKALQAGQTVKVLRYTILEGQETALTDVSAEMTNNGLEYTYTPSEALPETLNTLYRYKVLIEDEQGRDLSGKDFTYRLDTIVENMNVAVLDTDKNIMVLKANGISEIEATLKYRYPTGSGSEYSEWSEGTKQEVLTADRAKELGGSLKENDVVYVLNLANYNRYTNTGIELQTIDAAGNVSTQKINAMRNLFNNLNTEVGPDATNKPTGLINQGYDQRLITDGNQQKTATQENGGVVATDGNDTIIVGLDNFGGFGVSNGSLGGTSGIGGHSTSVDTGAGDDFIHIRGSAQSLKGGTFTMGEGNDKLVIDGGTAIGSYAYDMGEGNNIIEIHGNTVAAATQSYTFGNGNDILRVDASEFDGSKTIEFGDGYNVMEAETLRGSNTINFGKDDDTFIVNSLSTLAGSNGNINMGAGNDTFIVKTQYASGFKVNLGEGDDTAIISSPTIAEKLDGGLGNDTLIITNTKSKVSLEDVLNFETVDLTTEGSQTVGMSIDYLRQANNEVKQVYVKGTAADTVDLGDNGKNVNGFKIKDGGGLVKSNWNYWEKTESDVVHDGVTYDKYTYRTSSGETGDEAIYIQQGIQII
ncbi:hypothetical protein BKK50_08330, partial [Rodentibacter rarus]